MTTIALAPVTALSQESASRKGTAGVTRLRLTRRGRILFGTIITLFIAGVLAMVAALASPSAVATVEEQPDSFSYVVAEPGDTLWQIATELDPAADPRDLVFEIVRLNQLSDSSIRAGVPLAVPAKYAGAAGTFRAEELGATASS